MCRLVPDDAYEMPSCEAPCPWGGDRPVCDEKGMPRNAALCRRPKGHEGDHWAPSGEVWGGGAYVPKCYISTCHERPTVTRKITIVAGEGPPREEEIQVCAKHDELLDGTVQLGMPVIGEESK